MPLITVLMPAYNCEAYVGEAIRSVLEQSFTDYELLIINDGSTDGTVAAIEAFTDPRIRLVHNPTNLRLIETLNRGIGLVQSPLIARMDADDISLPERLGRQAGYMQRHPGVAACGTWFDSFGEGIPSTPGGRYLPRHEDIRLRHLYQIHIEHATVMMRTDAIRNHGLRYDAAFPHAEDYDLFDRLGKVARLGNIQETLVLKRQHTASVSHMHSEVQRDGSERVRMRILSDIGVEADSRKLMLIKQLMHQEYDKLAGSVPEVSALLSSVVSSNAMSHYFPEDFLRKELGTRFLHLCNGLAGKDPDAMRELMRFPYARFTDSPATFAKAMMKSLMRR